MPASFARQPGVRASTPGRRLLRRIIATTPRGGRDKPGLTANFQRNSCPPARSACSQKPEPIEAIATVPDGPPLRFRWRRVLHEVAAFEGPERIAPEWRKQRGASPAIISAPRIAKASASGFFAKAFSGARRRARAGSCMGFSRERRSAPSLLAKRSNQEAKAGSLRRGAPRMMPAPLRRTGGTTNFSFLRGASHPEELVEQAIALGLKASASPTAIRSPVSCAPTVSPRERERPETFRLAIGAGSSSATARPTFSPIRRSRRLWPPDAAFDAWQYAGQKGLCRLIAADLLEAAEGQQLIVMPASTWEEDGVRSRRKSMKISRAGAFAAPPCPCIKSNRRRRRTFLRRFVRPRPAASGSPRR